MSQKEISRRQLLQFTALEGAVTLSALALSSCQQEEVTPTPVRQEVNEFNPILAILEQSWKETQEEIAKAATMSDASNSSLEAFSFNPGSGRLFYIEPGRGSAFTLIRPGEYPSTDASLAEAPDPPLLVIDKPAFFFNGCILAAEGTLSFSGDFLNNNALGKWDKLMVMNSELGQSLFGEVVNYLPNSASADVYLMVPIEHEGAITTLYVKIYDDPDKDFNIVGKLQTGLERMMAVRQKGAETVYRQEVNTYKSQGLALVDDRDSKEQ